MGKIIYLATLYTHPSPTVMDDRFKLTCKLAGALMAQQGKPMFLVDPETLHSTSCGTLAEKIGVLS